MTTPTETPPTTDPIRDAFRIVIAFLQLLTMPRALVNLTGIPEIVERAARYFVRDSYTLNPAVTELRELVERAAEEHARRTEPQNASLEERVLTPGERAAFLAGVSAADEDREFDEHRTCATPTDDPPLTEADLRAAEERCERATPGPWEIDPNAEDRTDVLSPSQQCAICYVPDEDSKDGAFIAAARTDLPRALREIRRLRATVDAAAKHLGCEPHVLVLCASSRMAEIERLTAILREARRRLAPLPRALTPEDHEPDTLPARIDAVLGGKDH